MFFGQSRGRCAHLLIFRGNAHWEDRLSVVLYEEQRLFRFAAILEKLFWMPSSYRRAAGPSMRVT